MDIIDKLRRDVDETAKLKQLKAAIDKELAKRGALGPRPKPKGGKPSGARGGASKGAPRSKDFDLFADEVHDEVHDEEHEDASFDTGM